MSKRHYGQIGGLVTAHTTQSQHEADLKQVKKYLDGHSGCTNRDVAMACHLTNRMADRMVAKARGDLPD